MTATEGTIHGARYLDGQVAREHEVTLAVSGAGVTIHMDDTSLTWPRGEIELVDDLDRGARVRFSHTGEPNARIIVLGRKEAGLCRACWPEVFSNRRGGLRRDMKRLAIGVVGLAVVGAIAITAFPLVISVLAALVPTSTERRIGDDAFAAFARIMPAVERRCADGPGLAVIERLTRTLTAGINLDTPPRVQVVPHSLVNAVAFPGGQVLIFQGLVSNALTGAEVAGVLAHEIGHVYHRHGMKRVIRDSAIDAVTSVFAPATTGSIGGTLASTLASQSYGRDAEREADEFAVQRLNSQGFTADGIVAFFERAQASETDDTSILRFLQSHPGPDDRIGAIRAQATGTGPVLDGKDWQALRNICRTVETD